MITILASILLLTGLNAFAANESVYTSIEKRNCRTIEDSELQKNAEIDFYTGYCPGKNGYTVVISGGDLRYELSLKVGRKIVNLTEIFAFNEMGSKSVEWRGPAGTTQYNSLIYRLQIQVDQKSSASLYVVRLAGKSSCVIGVVHRAIAEDMSMPCLPKATN